MNAANETKNAEATVAAAAPKKAKPAAAKKPAAKKAAVKKTAAKPAPAPATEAKAPKTPRVKKEKAPKEPKAKKTKKLVAAAEIFSKHLPTREKTEKKDWRAAVIADLHKTLGITNKSTLAVYFAHCDRLVTGRARAKYNRAEGGPREQKAAKPENKAAQADLTKLANKVLKTTAQAEGKTAPTKAAAAKKKTAAKKPAARKAK